MRLPRPNATPVRPPRQGNVSAHRGKRVGVSAYGRRVQSFVSYLISRTPSPFSEKNLPLRPARRHAETFPPAFPSILSDGKSHDKGCACTGAALDGD